MKKVAVLFGGRSQEHEISILSASAVIGALNAAGFEPVPIGIGKRGDWYHIISDMDGIVSLDDKRFRALIPNDGNEASEGATRIEPYELTRLADFAFPVLHGPYGEDGTVQGLFEMFGMPYAGCGVAASAIAMDKIFSKELLIRAGLPVCGHTAAYAKDFAARREQELCRIETELGYPVFVKPANMGSSVGVGRATDRAGLAAAIDEALKYDSRILIETEVKGRELETAILGNDDLQPGAVGEIVTESEFYDYDTKYRGSGARLDIPADIPERVRDEIRGLACAAFRTLGGSGFSRVDFFLEEGTEKVYINEMNTIPGFTRYSMFPLLWEANGVDFAELVERIVGLGYERHYAKNHR
ncbi:MAG: D-alanine--D-alanine ligase [Clostridiales Family XIII bacterium]|jgi:D-alanine-D-alanine ligase|nr:D-alanine--D-alanine ligase [Clostridiales Family XIII bacterium]